MPDDRIGSSLSRGDFKREQLAGFEQRHVTLTFGSPIWAESGERRWTAAGTERLVDEVVQSIGDGKEATVYWCAMDAHLDFEWAVAKVYRAQKFRAFSNAAHYIDETQLRDRRQRKAVQRRTRVGRRVAHALWVEREWNTLCKLYDAGGNVPTPYARSADAILMEYVGDDEGPAPLLCRADLSPEESERAFDDVLRNVEILLACELVHGDLSAYNVLWWEGQVKIIDLPQAVDASAPDAYPLLDRDIRNVGKHFARAGTRVDPGRIVESLWRRRLRGSL